MLLAVKAGERIVATPGNRATCPGCDAEVIAKCGDLVVWHWSHRPRGGEDCDPWWEESAWHLGWKAKFPRPNVEVVCGPHRADVKLGELVIEFQHSSISLADVRARESFYGNMVWVFDVAEAWEAGRLEVRDRGSFDNYRTFRWHRPWAVIGYCKKPVFLDLGDGTLLEMRRLHMDKRPAGWGYLHTESEWIRRVGELGPYAPCSECGWAWFHGHDFGCPQSALEMWEQRRAG